MDLIKSKYPHILESIRTEKALSDKTNAELKQILEEFIPTAGLQMKAWRAAHHIYERRFVSRMSAIWLSHFI